MRVTPAIPLLLWFALPVLCAEHAPPPEPPASTYAAVEAHEAENVIIAAEPYDTRQKQSIFRVDYLIHGILPVRLIVTNNSDRPISLSEARILFQTAAGDRIQAAQPADVERRMTFGERTGKKLPLPPPLPSIKLKPKASDSQIEQDFADFEYQAITVPPHSTRAGFLFYDVAALETPLQGAMLHLHKLLDADGNELFYFEIPFDKYLQSKSNQMN